MGTAKAQMLTKPACKIISLHMKSGRELKIPLFYVIKAEVEGKKLVTGWSFDNYAG